MTIKLDVLLVSGGPLTRPMARTELARLLEMSNRRFSLLRVILSRRA
jgi:hypothetical protein